MNSFTSGPNTSFGNSPAAIELYENVRYDAKERAKVARTLQRYNLNFYQLGVRFQNSHSGFNRLRNKLARLLYEDEARNVKAEVKLRKATETFLLNVMTTRYKMFAKHGI